MYLYIKYVFKIYLNSDLFIRTMVMFSEALLFYSGLNEAEICTTIFVR